MLRLLVDFHGVLQITDTYIDANGNRVRYSKPYPGSQEAIRELSNYYEIVVVSSMMAEAIPSTAKFLEYYFPEIDYNNWVFTSNKYLVCGDVMVDDGESNLRTSTCPIKILFNYKPQFEYIQFKQWDKLANYLIEIAEAYWGSFANETNTTT